MSFVARRAAVHARIAAACDRANRDPDDVAVLAVSKTRSAQAVREALAAGQVMFGENRVQELEAKAGEFEAESVRWHLIGSLQTNKVGTVLRVPQLDLLHSLDRLKLAEALERPLADADRALDVLLQIAATGETGKHGVSVAAAVDLMRWVAADCPHLRLRGVMAMGPRQGDPAPVFSQVARLRDEMVQTLGAPLPILSLGMSRDLEAAIEAGSTLLRIGSGLFGEHS